MASLKHRLMSRKFWLSVVSAVLVILNDGLELGLDEETVMNFVRLVLGFLIVEGARDVARAYRTGV